MKKGWLGSMVSSTGMAVAMTLAMVEPGTALAKDAPAGSAEVGDVDLDALLARMTVQEKLGQLVQRTAGGEKSLNSYMKDEELEAIRSGAIGSYLNAGGAAQLREYQRIAVEESRLGIPLLFAMDVIHGYRTIFPVPLGMAASFDASVAEDHARVAALETAAIGVHWTFTPMVDIARDPRWGRIVEGAGEDAYLGSRLAEAQVRGFQGDDLSRIDTVIATTKHFAAYGAAEGGRDYAAAEMSEATLREVYLPPFRAAADAGSRSMMTSFNTLNGVPATGNSELLRGILRDEWGWDGVLISDWRSIAEMLVHGFAGERVDAGKLALEAGVDIDMVADIYAEDMVAAVEADPALMARLDESVMRVLEAKRDLGLFADPYRYNVPAREDEWILTAEGRAKARDAAEKAIVLLKNEGDLLPLAANAGKVALIGALADDGAAQLGPWHAQGRPEDVITLRSALQDARPGVTYTPAVHIRPDSPASDIPAAVAAAEQADVVVLALGEYDKQSGEGHSRASIDLPGDQLELLKAVAATGKPIVVVMMTGRPMAIPEVSELADAVLYGWYLGVEAGPALTRTLMGEANPGAKLPASLPRTTGQVPINYDHLPTGRPGLPDPTELSSRYIDVPVEPLYAFGHGLSYTDFTLGEAVFGATEVPAQGGSVTVSVPVTNTGERAGDEVVQLYMRDPVASTSRPVAQLRGYKRVSLAPGETKTVTFTLSSQQFAYWKPGSGWTVDAGEIELMVGNAVDAIHARATIEVIGSAAGSIEPAAIETPVNVY